MWCFVVSVIGSKSLISELGVRVKGWFSAAIFKNCQSTASTGYLENGFSYPFLQMLPHAVFDWHSLAGRMDESVTGGLIALLVSA